MSTGKAHVAPRAPRSSGTWINRADALDVLAGKHDKGLIDDTLAEQLRSLIERGFAHLPGAVAPSLVDRYRELFDRVWDAPPRELMYIDNEGHVARVNAGVRDKIVRVVNLNLHFDAGPAIMFPDAVLRLLGAVYERPPVCFQTMSFRHGSRQPVHVDTAYLPLVSDPLDLLASWTALEDVEPGSGELIYYEGSHRIGEFLFDGRSKALSAGPEQHDAFLEYLTTECERRGLPLRRFTPRKGDVLIWTADFAHGGGEVTRPGALRRSLVCHFMPYGTRPSFYDASRECIVGYGPAFRLQRESEAPTPVRRLLRVLSRLAGR